MLGLENKTAIKERKFTSALIQRIGLIRNILNLKGGQYAFSYVEPVFKRNLPANLVEIADMISKIRGVVSDETLRNQLPFVLENEEEVERLEKERQASLDYEIITPPSNTPTKVNLNKDEESEDEE